MSRNRPTFLLGLILLNSGCTLAVDITRNLSDEICECSNDYVTSIRNHSLASAACRNYQESNQSLHCSSDFAQGFKEGYVSCLEASGAAVPPCFPPLHYGRESYSPQWEPAAIKDWYAGYSSGVAMAQSSGNHAPTPSSSRVVANAKQSSSRGPGADKPSPSMEMMGTPYARYPQ